MLRAGKILCTRNQKKFSKKRFISKKAVFDPYSLFSGVYFVLINVAKASHTPMAADQSLLESKRQTFQKIYITFGLTCANLRENTNTFGGIRKGEELGVSTHD